MDETLPPHKPPGSGPASAGDRETRELGARDADGARLGPYVIEVKVGEGGMGKVYRCYDPTLKRRVAIKVLHDRYVRDPRYKARFLREAQTVASLTHPAVAHVYSIDTSDDRLSIVMEYVDGTSLEQALESDGAFPVNEAIRLIRETAEGLRTAFVHGIIHRDVKPSNILLSRSGQVKIVDFGLAKDLGSGSAITDDGIVLGTPQYISPEQGRGLKVDQRSDIYSLGATFYHLITGKAPFEDRSQIGAIVAHVQERPEAPHEIRSGVRADVSRVIGHMMATEPRDRYPAYGELIEDLDALLASRRPLHATGKSGRFGDDRARSRSRRLAAGLGAVLLLAALTASVDSLIHRADPGSLASQSLQGWYIARPEGVDVLHFDFSDPPPGVDDVARKALIVPDDSRQGASPPALYGGALRWENYTRPFACSWAFERVDQMVVHVTEHTGRFDLAISLAHPDGSVRRLLMVPLRPADEQPRPLLALENNDAVESIPPGGAVIPRLVPPYKVLLGFETRDGSTKVNLKIYSERGTLYDRTFELPGDDWSSGVLVLKTSSARFPFSVALGEVIISGNLAVERPTEVPWRS